MRDSVQPKRLNRSPRARLLALAALMSAILVAGCVGSSPSSVPGAGATSSGSTAPGAYGSGPIGFSRCMRANGVPNFPDPSPRGGARFSIPVGNNPAAPAFKAAQAKCQKILPGAGELPNSGPPASTQTLLKLLKIARCMRRHGVPQFPDPTTSLASNPAGIREIINYDGAILVFPATITLQAPAYKLALATCDAPPLGLPH